MYQYRAPLHKIPPKKLQLILPKRPLYFGKPKDDQGLASGDLESQTLVLKAYGFGF